jgi:hypothetical protein
MPPKVHDLRRLQGSLRALRLEEIDVIGAFTARAEVMLGIQHRERGPASASGAATSWLTPAGGADLGEAADRAK